MWFLLLREAIVSAVAQLWNNGFLEALKSNILHILRLSN